MSQLSNRTLFTGDNLPILRGMNSESVDLIYLDPPFNSNKTYSAPIGSEAAGAAFKDSWTLDDIDAEWHGQIADEHPGLYKVIDGAGAAHSKGMQAYLIMMGVRMIEMQRILRPTGSIYLHCDDVAGAYLKTMMDAIWGAGAYRNEITWQRQSAHSDGAGFGRVADTIYFYGSKINKDSVRVPLSEQQAKAYSKQDDKGRFTVGDMSAKGLTGGGYNYDFHGHFGPWRYPEARARELDAAGRVYIPANGGVPRLKRYLHEHKGIAPGSMWTDIPPVQSHSKERTGYPTQKPLSLLERIIRASSNEGDYVFDPFCGCATTLVAAEKLSRKWGGGPTSPISPSSWSSSVSRASWADYCSMSSTAQTSPRARIKGSCRTIAVTRTDSTASRRGTARLAGRTSRFA